MKHYQHLLISLNNTLTFIILVLFLTTQSKAQLQFDDHILAGGENTALGVCSVFAIDLDGDNDIDVLSASRDDHKIAWYENDGFANFTPHIITTKADGACYVNAIDLDKDGDIDVLSASNSWENHAITWYENDGNCNFTVNPISTDFEGARSVYATDLDNDQDIDVIAVYEWELSRIEWFENNGEENFTKHIVRTDSTGLISISISDINNDGLMDIVSVSTMDNKVIWYKNEGNKTFSTQIVANNQYGSVSVHAVDINKDGDVDILTSWADYILLHENDGSENFVTHIINDTCWGVQSILTLDMNNDGNIDVLASTEARGNIVWYQNDGSGHFDYNELIDSVWFANSIYAADLDGDSDIDLLSASSDSFSDDKLLWHENDGNNNFYSHNITISIGNASNLLVKDLDKDGDLDILAASIFSYHGIGDYWWPPRHGKIIWFENIGKQNYKFNMIDSFEEVANKVNVLDIDGDGYDDILVSLSEFGFYGKICWYSNIENQSYNQPQIIDSTYGVTSISAADMENDGDIDLFVGITNSWDLQQSEIVWYENDGMGKFSRFFITDSIKNVKSVCAVDLDKDGDIDIISGHLADKQIVWLENDGSQNFNSHIIKSNGKEAILVISIDMDEDGDLDIITASNEDKNISWFENDGSQNFTSHNIADIVYEVSKLSVFDLDKDGHLDLIPSPMFEYEFSWLKNDGYNNFIKVIQPSLEEVIAVIPIDFDKDGDNDLITSGWSSLTFYENLDTSITKILNSKLNHPQKYYLTQNYPNPFNPSTTIKYSIPTKSNVILKVYDVLGREVSTLINELKAPGNYEIKFDASELTSGIYFYKLKSNNLIQSKKMLVLK